MKYVVIISIIHSTIAYRLAAQMEITRQRHGAFTAFEEMDKITELRCVAVGDRNVGKSCIFSTFTDNELCNERFTRTPSAFVMIDRKPIRLILSDTIDFIDNGKKRAHSCQPTDVVLICFSIVNVVSFKNVRTKWYPIVRNHYPNTPIILVGTKLDLRSNFTSITNKQGELMAKKIKAVKYLECSALIRLGVQVVIEEAIRAALIEPTTDENKQPCKII